jgi:DNA-binding transcriptional LysR family regulator
VTAPADEVRIAVRALRSEDPVQASKSSNDSEVSAAREASPAAESTALRGSVGELTGPTASRQPLKPPSNHVYFEAVSSHGSIRKAAAALHIASSALNRRILDLEEEVGSPLFERLPRGVRLTTAGELYLAYVRRSAKDLQTLETQLLQLRGQTRGAVRVAVAETVTPRLLPKVVASYRRNHAAVAFHVLVSGPAKLTEALLADEVDLILTHDPPEQPAVTVLASSSHPLCALVAPGHPLAARKSVQLSDCTTYPWAMPDKSLAARMLLDRAMEQAALPFPPTLESNSIETLKAFARLGEAVCFSFHLGSEAEALGMVAVKLKDRLCAKARLYLAARKGRVLPVAAATFAEELTEALTDEVGASQRAPA